MITAALAFPWFAAVLLAPLDGKQRRVGRIAAAALVACLGALLQVAVSVVERGPLVMTAGGWPEGVGITLRADGLGIVFALLVNGVILAALLYELFTGVESRTFPSLVLFLSVGLTGLFLTGDLFNFYVFFEISMTSAFVLTSYGESPRQIRATLIFVVVNLLGSVLFLAAVAGLYRATGTLDMQVMSRALLDVHPNTQAIIGSVLLSAFGLKIGLFPFHSWLPPVYRDSSPAVAAILSGALANIGSYGLLRLGGEVMPGALQMGIPLLLVLGTLSVLYGAGVAIARFPTQEVLAYSSIGQAGYILIAIAVGGPVGLAAAVVYSIVNSLNKTLLFLASGLRGWLVGAAFAIGAFSLAGVPPAAGFLGKASVFRAGIDAGNPAVVALVFAGGALSFVYMFRIYQGRFWAEDGSASSSPLPARLLVMLVAALVLFLGVWPEPLLAMGGRAAGVLVGGAP